MIAVINTETGQIVTVIKEGDRILRKGSLDSASEIERPPDKEPFTKLYQKIMPTLIDTSLTTAEVMTFLYLASNLRYMSNVAKFANGNLITRDTLQNNLSLSERTVKSVISKLIREGLIVEAITLEGRVFVVNPYVVMVGDRVNKTVFDLFRKSKWARW